MCASCIMVMCKSSKDSEMNCQQHFILALPVLLLPLEEVCFLLDKSRKTDCSVKQFLYLIYLSSLHQPQVEEQHEWQPRCCIIFWYLSQHCLMRCIIDSWSKTWIHHTNISKQSKTILVLCMSGTRRLKAKTWSPSACWAFIGALNNIWCSVTRPNAVELICFIFANAIQVWQASLDEMSKYAAATERAVPDLLRWRVIPRDGENELTGL